MPQMVMADGGMVSEPKHYYNQNMETYQYINQRLSGTQKTYLESDKDTRLRLLMDSATYALITAHTPLDQADRAFEIYRDHYPEIDVDSLGVDFKENGIGFYNNKARYIRHNLDHMDTLFAEIDDNLMSGDSFKAQELLMDAHGLGPAKSAFTLSMLGWTDHVCLDTHVCQYLGLNPRDYENHEVEEYTEMAREAFEQLPSLKDEISPFLLQWLIFDINRGEIETHDLWFTHVIEVTH